jgi:Terminase small subunit
MENNESKNSESAEPQISANLIHTPKKRKLSLRENRFVEAMANPEVKSAAEAARRAGYSEKSARFIAYKTLAKVYISEAIERRKRRAIIHSRVTPQEVLGSAVFNMRSSINDALDEDGNFSIEKARATGVIDLIKKYKQTIRTTYMDGVKQETITIIEIEIASPAEARQEVARYLKIMDKKGTASNFYIIMTDAERAADLIRRMVERHNWSEERALEAVKEKYPHIDYSKLKLLSEEKSR